MNATLVIARRELAEKRFVFTAAAALAVIVALMPLVPGIPSGNGRNVLVVAASILGVGFVLGLAAILGTTIVGRELSEKRLSFYFSKPIPAASIWSGKLIAAAILLTSTFLIVSLPALFAGKKAIQQVWSGEGRNLITALAILVTAFFFIGHILSTIARARSAWAFVDFAALAALSFVTWLIVRPLVDALAMDMLGFVLKIGGWLLLIAATLAGAWQISVGRTDRQRSHLAQMRFLWPAAAVAIAIAGLFVAWIVNASLSDLTGHVNGYTAERSEYAIVSGEAKNRRDFHPGFLVHLPTGDVERIAPASPFFGAVFVEGGKRVLVFRLIDRKEKIAEVFVRDLAKGSREQSTGLTVGNWRGEIVTTPDVSRIAYVSNDVLSVYDTVARQLLGSVRVPANEFIREMWFASPDVLRVHTISGGGSKPTAVDRAAIVYEYDLKARVFRKTGEHHQTSTKFVATLVSPDRTKLIIRDGVNGGSIVADIRTLAPIATLPGADRAVALTDGRFAALDRSAFRVLSPSGAEERAVAIPQLADGENWGAREIAAGKVVVAGKEKFGARGQGWRVLLIDVNSGAILRNETGLMPMGMYWARTPVAAHQLFETLGGDIVMWNPITNEKKVLIRKAV